VRIAHRGRRRLLYIFSASITNVGEGVFSGVRALLAKHLKRAIWEMRLYPHGCTMSQCVQGVGVPSAAKGKDWRTLLDEATVAEFGRAIAAE
jgi:hypothetical protein